MASSHFLFVKKNVNSKGFRPFHEHLIGTWTLSLSCKKKQALTLLIMYYLLIILFFLKKHRNISEFS